MYKSLVFFFIAVTVVGFGWTIFPIKERDYALFDGLIKSSNPEAEESLFSHSQQKREGVCKHIWYQDDTPLYFRIDSQESELFFLRQNHKVEVIEHLDKVQCLMQEELYYEEGQPMQRIRYLEAERACYHYNSNLFVASDAKLWKYILEGHNPPTEIQNCSPLMQAKAQSIEFSLKGDQLNFVAQRMQAIVNSKERSL